MSDPIVLVHGMFGFGHVVVGGAKIASYFRDIPEALRQDGHIVPKPPQVNSAGCVIDRASDLKRFLEDPANVEVFGKRVHIIAHSMGGLDTRYMVSQLDMADRVLSLTTIGTPHHGSPIADLVIQGTDRRLIAFIETLEIKGIGDLTTAKCEQFNQHFPESPRVRYYSVASHFEPPRPLGVPLGVLGLTHDLIQDKEGDNDGLVSVASAKSGSDAGRWTFLGNWECNHIRQVNWGTDIVPTPAELLDNTIIEKYRSIAARIVRDQAAG